MPVLGVLMGGLNFSGLAVKVGSATLKYGKFLQTCLDFLIIAWAIFLVVKLINRLKREEPEKDEPKAPPRQEALLEEIRDLLKKALLEVARPPAPRVSPGRCAGAARRAPRSGVSAAMRFSKSMSQAKVRPTNR